ncbi:MAG: S26 family signal peptidase [Methanoregula sp.]|nr:S26 family signal peptidase [Methanoregula sp.]
MADKEKTRDIRTLIKEFRTSEHWAVSLARDLIWVVAVVGCIALALVLICGTWPAVVTIESGSMIPNMNIGDLVVVVQKDRFGDLQTWDDGMKSGYKKFGDYGDVIIYRPNGATDMWASVGLLPLSKAQHPIIHRAMTWTEAGQPVPSYLNIYRGKITPTGYLPLTVSGETANGYQILSTGAGTPAANFTPGTKDLTMQTPQGNYVLPAGSIVPNSGYVRNTNTTATHGGYITKGDNNNFSDQGYLPIPGMGTVEPVKKEWVVGKALFTVPYVGLLPLHIGEVIIAVIILMVLHELYLRRKEAAPPAIPQKKSGKKQR